VRLALLGPVAVDDGEVPLDLGPPKQRALLALLALHADTVVPLDTLVDRLWNGAPPGRAEAGLQIYVSHLRSLLEPGRRRGDPARVLQTRPPGYLLDTHALEVDVRDFADATGRGRSAAVQRQHAEAVRHFEAALALWRGEALADVRDAPWAQAEAARLEQQRLDAVEDLAQARLDANDPRRVAADLTAVVEASPLRERAWRLLALALYRCDRQADALAALSSAGRHLQEELGVDPGRPLQDLELAILRHDDDLLRPPAASPAQVDVRGQAVVAPLELAHGSPEAPFVGRGAELAVLRAAWESAARRGAVVVLEGEPGIGKSALAARFVREVDVPVAWGICPEHEVAPALWPWEAVLRTLRDARPGLAVPAEITSLLDHAQPLEGSAVQDAAGARLRLFGVVAGYLAAAAPLVVVLDDLQWADITSTRLLVQLAAAAPPGLLVVATCRTSEAAALTPTLAALTRFGSVRLALAGLARDDVRALVRDLSGADPGEREAASVTQRTAGNPLFVTLLAGVPDGSAAPRLLQDVVLQRLQTLPPETADLLRTAAIAGQEVDVEVLAEVSGVRLDDVIEALDQARAAELLRDDDTPLGTYRFAHALVRDALDSGHSRLRRARWHRRFAEVTERQYAGDDDRAGQVARHWLAAAELDPACAARAVVHTTRAARSAMRRLAPEDAVASWQECLVAERLAGGDPQVRFEALVGLIEAHVGAGATAEGAGLLDEALTAADGDPQRITRIAVAVLGQSPWYPFDYRVVPERLLAELEAAVRALPPDLPEVALALACLGALQCQAGLLDESPVTSSAAVDVARALPAGTPGAGPQLLARVLFLRLLALTGFQHAQDALATARDLLAVPAAPAPLVAVARIMEVSAALTLGLVEEARSAGEALSEAVAAARSPVLDMQHAFVRSALLALQGRLDEAEDVTPYLAAGALENNHVLSSWTSQRCERALQRGTLGDLVDELAAVRRRTGLDGYGAAQALGLLQLGRRDEARAVVEAMRTGPHDYGWFGAVACLLPASVELGDLERVRSLREQLLPYQGRLGVLGSCTCVLGAVSGHLGEASLALGELDAAREQLTAAVELLERADSPYWSARARAALARCG